MAGVAEFFIRRDDAFGLYDDSGSSGKIGFRTLADGKGWGTSWPRTNTGKLALTAGRSASRPSAPELKPLQHLRDQIAELRLGRFLNTIGADGYSRCPIMPFWTRSGRNQPSGRDKVFLLSLPSWLHGLIAPPPGMGMALLDWKAQEIGIAAGLSNDPALIADFQAGDPHMGFAIRVGLAPIGATAETHGDIRNMVKPISLGSNYGMSKYGAAAQSGKSLAWAATTLASHRHAYPVFTQWQQNMTAQALFDERIASVFGWPMAVHAGTKQRTLLNYPAQANGGECMRVAAIAAYEAGIRIAAPAHDAFWIIAPLSELTDTIIAMKEIMIAAGRAVAGIDIPVDVSARGALAELPGRCPQAESQGAGDVDRDSGAARQRRPTGHGGIMKKRRAKLYLVGQDPAEIFDDLDRLKSDLTAPPQRRARATETFARVPHDRALALYKHRLSSAAWAVLIELDRLILKRRGQNPVRFASARLRAAGIKENVRALALRQLAAAGAVRVLHRGPGLPPMVTHLWYPSVTSTVSPVTPPTVSPVTRYGVSHDTVLGLFSDLYSLSPLKT